MQGEFNTKCQTVINCAEEGNVIVGEYQMVLKDFQTGSTP